MSNKTELEYKCIELGKYKYRRPRPIEAFLRPAFQGTSAECKDRTQQELHEFDYLK